jgi:hypothetical protein
MQIILKFTPSSPKKPVINDIAMLSMTWGFGRGSLPETTLFWVEAWSMQWMNRCITVEAMAQPGSPQTLTELKRRVSNPVALLEKTRFWALSNEEIGFYQTVLIL